MAGKEIAIPERLKKDIEKFPQYKTKHGHSAYLEWPWKIHRIQIDKKRAPIFELYNLELDPMESRNIAATHPEIMKDMMKKLDNWQTSVLNSLNGLDYK